MWRTPPATASFTQAKPVLASGPFAPLSPGKFVLVQETCYRKSQNFEPCLSFQMTMNILTAAPAAAVLTITASRLEDILKKIPKPPILGICLEEEGKNSQFFPGTQASVSN